MTVFVNGVSKNPSTATIVVAASDSRDTSLATPGYVCDGTADEAQINAAITALPSEGGEIVCLEGTYATAAPITINPVSKNRVWLTGHGALMNYSGSGNAITVNHAGGDQKKRAHIEGFHIVGTGSGAAGIALECVYSTCLRDLVIEDFTAGYGIHLDLTNDDYSGEQTLVQDVRIVDCDRGIFADAGSVKTSFNETHLERVQVVLQNAGTTAFYLEGDWSRAYIDHVIVHLIRDSTTVFKFLGTCDSLVIMKPGLETVNASTTFFDFSDSGFVGQPLIIHPYDATATNRYVHKSSGVGQQFFVIDEDNLWHGRVLNKNGNISSVVTATETRATLSYDTGNYKIGTRALKATCNDAGGAGNSLLNWHATDWLLPDYTVTELRGKWITAGFWAMGSASNDKAQRVVFSDDTTLYHQVIPQDATWRWYNLTLKVDDSATGLHVQVYSKYTSDADTDDILIVDGVTIVEGLSCPSYMPSGYIDQRTFSVDAFQYPAPGTDWTPELNGAGLAASKTTKKCWLPLNFLKASDEIVSYNLVGDATETNALTLDCKLVRINKADPITTTDVAGGGITQIDASGNFDSAATLTAPEVVATDKQYVLELLGTTGVDDTITVMGAEVVINRLG